MVKLTWNDPYVFVGGNAFPLRKNLVKPYSRLSGQENFVANYRISRARRVVKNAFEIATSHFRIFSRPILAGVELAETATKAVIALHNFLKNKDNESNNYCLPEMLDQDLNGNIIPGQ